MLHDRLKVEDACIDIGQSYDPTSTRCAGAMSEGCRLARGVEAIELDRAQGRGATFGHFE
jgi:hypothetical protein